MAKQTWRRAVLAFLMLPILVDSASHDMYRAPILETEDMETYVFEDKEYMISAGKKSWLDAQFICQSYNGSLSILDTPDKALFMAEALSESGLMLEDIWVGAKREGPDDPGGYKWIAGEQSELVRTDADIWDFTDISSHNPPPKHYPSWINRTGIALPDDGANCVGFERGFHDIPVFVDLHCKVKRGYTCERDMVRLTRQQNVTEIETVKCANYEYHVFNGRITFEEAAGHCALHGMMIAMIESMKCLEKVARRMLKSRPSIENAWIGAKGNLGTWKWIETGVPVEEKPEGYDASDPLEASWPPFRPFIPRKQEGCLLLDRHVCDHAVFLEARCERKRDFICVKKNKKSELASFFAGAPARIIPPSDDKNYYTLVYERMSWNQAETNCEVMNGTLATVLDPEIITQLLLVMGENVAEPVHHIWVNGKLRSAKSNSSNYNHTYEWVEQVTNKTIPRGDEDNIQGFYPPWCDDEINKDFGCLNLDRENHMTALVYGMPCQTMQYSICMIDKTKFVMPGITPNTSKSELVKKVEGADPHPSPAPVSNSSDPAPTPLPSISDPNLTSEGQINPAIDDVPGNAPNEAFSVQRPTLKPDDA